MTKTLWRLVYLLLIVYFIFYFVNSLLIIAYPYQISYPEGFLLNQAQMIAQGKTIYNAVTNTNYPFLVANYPPLYPYLYGLLVKLFGVAFAWGRIISFLSVIGCAFLIYLICKNIPLTLSLSHEGRGTNVATDKYQQRIGLVSSLLFLASPYVYKMSTQCRVDMLGLVLSLSGIWLALKYTGKKTVYLSVIFFVAALFTKQTFVAAPIALAIYVFLKNRITGLGLIVFTGLFYTIIFLTINAITGGELYQHNVLYNANPFSILFAAKMFFVFLKTHAVLVVFSVTIIIGFIKNKKSDLFSIYFFVALLTAITVGKIGSNINYFLELIAIGSILSGFTAYKLQHNRKMELLVPALFLVQLALFAHVPFSTAKTPIKKDYKEQAAISAIINETQGDILSEDAGMLVLNKEPVLFQPFEFTQLKRQGLWNQDRLVQDIQNEKFALMILGSDINTDSYDKERFTPEMIDAMRKSYALKVIIGDWYIYWPKTD